MVNIDKTKEWQGRRNNPTDHWLQMESRKVIRQMMRGSSNREETQGEARGCVCDLLNPKRGDKADAEKEEHNVSRKEWRFTNHESK